MVPTGRRASGRNGYMIYITEIPMGSLDGLRLSADG